MIHPLTGGSLKSGNIGTRRGEPALPSIKDRLQEFGEKSGLTSQIVKLRDAALSLRGRTYIEGAVIGSLGARYLSGLVFGPQSAFTGALTGLAVGLITAELLTRHWTPAQRNSEKKVPSGSDVNLDPHIQSSGLAGAELQSEIDRLTDSQVVEGNRVVLLKNGASSFPERYRMMEQAKDSINLQTLIFHSDETGWKTANLLAKKAHEGVKCRIIYDWVSSADSDPRMFQMMKDAGVEVIAFNTPADYQWHGENAREGAGELSRSFKDFARRLSREDLAHLPKWMEENGKNQFEAWKKNNRKLLERLKEYPPFLTDPNKRWHMKILSVDGQEAVIGGLNIGSEYAYGGSDRKDLSQGPLSFSASRFRDTDVKVEGPVVDRVNHAFALNWKYAGGADPESIMIENSPSQAKGDVSTRFVTHMPREKKDRNIENWYYQILKNTQKTAYITNAYFIPTPEFRKALISAAQRGVDVRVLTNSTETNDFALMTQAGRQSYKELLEGGVRIYELQKGNSGGFDLMHTKGAVFDGEAATIGSHNLDPRSFNTNSECTLVIQDKEFGREMQRLFKEDLGFANEYTLADSRAETPADKLEQWFGGQVVKELL